MKTRKTSLAMAFAALLITSFNAAAVTTTTTTTPPPPQQACATNVTGMLGTPAYKGLNAVLPLVTMTAFTNAVKTVSNFAMATDADYQVLVNLANATVAQINAIPVVAPAPVITSGRVVIALPDGTVIVDTGKPAKSVTDPVSGVTTTTGSTLTNFKAKTINENHNSRLAILNAQLWPCGAGVETKISTSVGALEVSVAKRMGAYLNSFGTVRVSFSK
jgi:hypothetical protein